MFEISKYGWAMLLMSVMAFASPVKACQSTVTLKVDSATYSGLFVVELRKGLRPGSIVVAERSMSRAGVQTFTRVCPGQYFFSLGTPDSDMVSVTQYFNVHDDGYTYNNPTLTIFYSRGSSAGQRVSSSKRNAL